MYVATGFMPFFFVFFFVFERLINEYYRIDRRQSINNNVIMTWILHLVFGKSRFHVNNISFNWNIHRKSIHKVNRKTMNKIPIQIFPYLRFSYSLRLELGTCCVYWWRNSEMANLSNRKGNEANQNEYWIHV